MTEETSALAQDNEIVFENNVRPKSLAEFVGQEKIRTQLTLLLQAAKLQNRIAEHILLSGPPGLGKTTLATIISNESNRPLRVTSGPAIQHAGDLAAILSSLLPGEILFIDEIHRMSRSAEEMLYLAMEDFRVDVMVGKGPGATSIPLEISPFTLIGATTRSGMLPNPLRDRFGFLAHLDFYADAELANVLIGTAKKLEIDCDTEALGEIAKRSRGTPRIANRLLRRVRDYSLVGGANRIILEHVQAALKVYEVDDLGLDRLDRAVLTALVKNGPQRAMGLSTIAATIGEEPDTVEFMVEPFLLRVGLISRSAKGRIATSAGFKHLGLAMPDDGRLDGLDL